MVLFDNNNLRKKVLTQEYILYVLCDGSCTNHSESIILLFKVILCTRG